MEINKDTDIYCSFSEYPGNLGCKRFNKAFREYNINAIYKSFKIKDIKDAVLAVKTLDIKGFAVSAPFKEKVLPCLNAWDESIHKVGACNTVVQKDGRLIGYNFDWVAWKRLIDLTKFTYNKFYILGNGGFSKACQFALQQLNKNYEIITRKNYTKLFDLQESVILNCTPVKDLFKTITKPNEFIDCDVNTETGRMLSHIQAIEQFKLYTGISNPIIDL